MRVWGGTPFNYRGGTPSTNLPDVPSAQSTMAGIGQRSLEDTSVADAIARGQNQSALGYAETLEDAQRDAIRREMAREQQNEERLGGGVIFGNTSAGEREQRLARRGLQRDFQSQQEKFTLAEAQHKQRAMEYALGLEARGAALDVQSAQQTAQLEARRELQMQLAYLRRAESQLNREESRQQNELNRQHASRQQKNQLTAQASIARAQLKQRERETLASIRRTQIANPRFSGGTMTAFNVSPGAHPSSRYAKWT